MPYYFEALETPIEEGRMWEQLEEIWGFIHYDLMSVRFESEEAALDKLVGSGLGVARYRDTDDRENLLHFHGVGLDALEETEGAIERREMSVHFMRQWSILLSCHGFIAAAMMARGSDVDGKRARIAARDAVSVEQQRIWFSHYFLRLYKKRGDRARVEHTIELLVNLAARGQVPDVDPAWFDKMLQKRRDKGAARPLTGAYRSKKLTIRKMRRLAQLATDDLPSLNLKVPDP